MSQDDVERVARAIIEARFADDDDGYDMPVTDYDRDLARAALSAMPWRELPPDSIPMPRNMGEARAMVLMGERMLRAGKIKEPGHELLREALSALECMLEWFDPPIARGLYEGERDAIADARAAADKIRASLTQERQT